MQRVRTLATFAVVLGMGAMLPSTVQAQVGDGQASFRGVLLSEAVTEFPVTFTFVQSSPGTPMGPMFLDAAGDLLLVGDTIGGAGDYTESGIVLGPLETSTINGSFGDGEGYIADYTATYIAIAGLRIVIGDGSDNEGDTFTFFAL